MFSSDTFLYCGMSWKYNPKIDADTAVQSLVVISFGSGSRVSYERADTMNSFGK